MVFSLLLQKIFNHFCPFTFVYSTLPHCLRSPLDFFNPCLFMCALQFLSLPPSFHPFPALSLALPLPFWLDKSNSSRWIRGGWQKSKGPAESSVCVGSLFVCKWEVYVLFLHVGRKGEVCVQDVSWLCVKETKRKSKMFVEWQRIVAPRSTADFMSVSTRPLTYYEFSENLVKPWYFSLPRHKNVHAV